MAPLQQVFAFERTAVRLDSGEYFLPLKDAKERWFGVQPEAYAICGSRCTVLYQLAQGGFVYAVYSCCEKKQANDGTILWAADRPPQATRISELEALQVLIKHQQPIPADLEPFLAQLGQRNQQARSRLPRPVEHWVARNLLSQRRDKSAQEVDALERARFIHELAVRAVQDLRSGDTSKSVESLGRELFCRYPVESDGWWGPKNVVPPADVELLQLPWPPGSDEVQDVLRTIQVLLIAPLSAQTATWLPIGDPDYPTPAEQSASRNAVLETLSELERQTVALGRELQQFEPIWDDTHEACKAEESIKPPSRNALAAFRESALGGGGTQEEIAARLGTNFGIIANQGTVSRWLKQVERWLTAGKALPPLPMPPPRKVIDMDPSKIDLGANPERRTPSQRRRGIPE